MAFGVLLDAFFEILPQIASALRESRSVPIEAGTPRPKSLFSLNPLDGNVWFCRIENAVLGCFCPLGRYRVLRPTELQCFLQRGTFAQPVNYLAIGSVSIAVAFYPTSFHSGRSVRAV